MTKKNSWHHLDLFNLNDLFKLNLFKLNSYKFNIFKDDIYLNGISLQHVVIHGILALLIPFFLIFLTGCVKPAAFSKTDLGKESSKEEVEFALAKAFYGVSPWRSQVKQQVVYDFNVRVESQENVNFISRLTQTLLKVENSPDNSLTLVTENFSQNKEDLESCSGERTESSNKFPGTNLNLTSLTLDLHPILLPPPEVNHWVYAHKKSTSKWFQLQKDLFTPQENRQPQRITYHNLQFEKKQFDPPLTVQQRPDCAGILNCKLNGSNTSFNQVLWYSDDEYEVNQWFLTVSPEAPYLSHILERCLSSFMKLSGRRYYVRQCQFARDFTYSGAEKPCAEKNH
ncbi:MAG: hypothetical protein K1X29_02420 [Bdellovibrionales bacterium]|nr:hypothetical protein [Bdellovibrionales bacterium]